MQESVVEKKLNIFQKLVEIRKRVIYIQKATRNPRFKYASTSDLLAQIRDAMDEQEVIVFTNITSFEIVSINGKECPKVWVEHTWINAENPSDTITTKLCFTETSQNGCQSSGAILTYAERYMLYKTFSVATDEADPDAFFADNEIPNKPKEATKETLKETTKEVTKEVTKDVVTTNKDVVTTKDQEKKRIIHTLSDEQASALAKVVWVAIETKTKIIRELDAALPAFLQDVQNKSPDFDIWKSVDKLTKDPDFFFERLDKWKTDNGFAEQLVG